MMFYECFNDTSPMDVFLHKRPVALITLILQLKGELGEKHIIGLYESS